MDSADYREADATSLAAVVRSGEVSDADLRALAHGQYAAVNPAINAVVEWYDKPTPVQSLDGPLAGVPILRKDYGSAEEGRLVEMGSRLAAGNVATRTASFINRLQAAGAQILGRTTTPEFVQHGATETALNGITRNPLDLETSPGGSSGGAGAAIAAGIVPAAHGSDCAGSIRIPASVCGLVGLKPGLHRILLDDGGWGGIANEFMLTRSVRDARLFLEVLADGPYLPIKPKYRIALSASHWAGCVEDPDVVAATVAAAAQLEALGHEVVEVAPPLDYEQLMDTFSALFHRWLVHDVDTLVAAGRVESPNTLEPLSLVALEQLRQLSAADISAAQVTGGKITMRLARELADYDVLLTPTLGRTTIPIGKLAGDVTDLDEYIRLNDESFPYSYLFNVSGWPSVSVPGQTSPTGQPIGVQFSATAGSEHVLLDLAEQIFN